MQTQAEFFRRYRPAAFGVALIASLVSCAKSGQPTVFSPTRTIPFHVIDGDHVSSQIQDFVAGELRFNEAGGTAVITRRLIRGSSFERPRTIAVGLAYGNRFNKDWRTRAKRKAVRLGRISASAADTLRDTLVLQLPPTGNLQLDQHWLIFEIWADLYIREQNGWVQGFDTFHSAPDIFGTSSR